MWLEAYILKDAIETDEKLKINMPPRTYRVMYVSQNIKYF